MTFREKAFGWFMLRRCECCDALRLEEDTRGFRIYEEGEIEGYCCSEGGCACEL